MVFDWFKRESAPAPAARPEETAPPEETKPEAEAGGAALTPAPEPAPEAGEEPAGAPAAADSAPTGSAAAPAPGGVDQAALDWARQAYARLKAQQEAAAAAAQAVAAPAAPAPSIALPSDASAEPPLTAETAPSAPAEPAAEPPAEPVAEPVAPAPAEAQGSQPPAASPAEPPAPAAPLSLLERAAAERQQRRQEILEAAAAAGAETPAAAAPPTPAPVAPPTAGPSAPAAAAPSADQAEPSLGAFDADFTWSAEVLAAQGRKVEDVSLEEIDWLTRLRRGLEKTRRGFVAQLLETLGEDPLSADSLDDIESSLLRADVGVQATDQVLEALRRRLNEEVVDPAEGLRFLKEQLRGILEEPIRGSGRELLAPERGRLNVWLMVGVNGVGKTTTLGKLANLAVRSGYSCLIAAADTFRAAAVQQVSVWGERSGVPVVSNPSANADPAAVVFDAIGAARAKGTELVLVDTAGRLQTKHNLMEELSKVRRIVDRLAPEAVVESLLVLDASQGQNGLRQAMAFASAAGLTGVVITKLDGSARGGVALAVASEAKLPIRFIGAGETIRDLRPFNSFEFVEALLGG